MFAKTIIDSDLFLDMPSSTQCLYFHLSMRADDDGFINNPKKIQRMVGSSDDDLKLLIAKNFIIPFESGVVVIKHWKIHNYIQKDRYKPTLHQNELEQLEVDKSKNYQIKLAENSTDTKCIHDVSKVDTQVRLGKDSIGKDSIPTEDKNVNECADNEKLSSMSKLYQENIGMANGIVAEWLIEISEQIDIDLFKRGLEICTERGNTTLGYLKGIIKKWLNNNITTLEQLKSYELQNKKYSTNSVSQKQENIQNTVIKDETNDPEFQRMLAEMNKKQEELNRMTFGGDIDE